MTRLGKPASDRRTLARVGYVHESPAFPRYLRAPELLEMYAAMTGIPASVRSRRVPMLLERVGLADRGREPIARFSKGMVQRLAIAQALLNEPDLLVLDEPNEGLDLPGRDLVVDLVVEHRRRGGSVLLVSHLMNDLDRLCDRLVVVSRGELVHSGAAAELAAREGGLEVALRALYRRGESA